MGGASFRDSETQKIKPHSFGPNHQCLSRAFTVAMVTASLSQSHTWTLQDKQLMQGSLRYVI